MKYLLIENKGEIDVNSLILMGGTSKREDSSKIGFYGSGNKYTIAGLLRLGINFKIFSGNKEIKITTEKVNFRGVTLDKIYIDGKETSLTKQMGPDWEPWFFVREQVQNALDEGEMNIVPNCENINSREGKTRFYIEQSSKIQEVIDNWNLYFSMDRDDTLYNDAKGTIYPNIHPQNQMICYKKGMKCSDSRYVTLFNYDIPKFSINESRVLSDSYEFHAKVCELLCGCTNPDVIRTFLLNLNSDHLEWSIFFYSVFTLSDAWRTAIGDRKVIVSEIAGWFMEEQQKYQCFILPDNLCKKIQAKFPEIDIFGLSQGDRVCPKRDYQMSARDNFLLSESQRFLKEANYSVDYPIKIVRFEDAETLGLAENDTIYIAGKLFEMGRKEIVRVLIEENEHLKTGYTDKSRAFQNHFINLYLSEMEMRIGNFL